MSIVNTYLGVLCCMCFSTFAQTGIDVQLPLAKLHVDGDVQFTGNVRLGGDSKTLGQTGEKGQFIRSNGPGKPASWVTLAIPEVPKDKSGSLIAIKGKLQFAEEMIYLLGSDFKVDSTSLLPSIINTVNVKKIDTYSKLTNGVFTVTEDGIYMVSVNAQLNYISFGTSDPGASIQPIIGVWEDNYNANQGRWIARVSSNYTAGASTATDYQNISVQTVTLLTSVELKKDTTYSFRITPGELNKEHELVVKAESDSSNGKSPVSYFSIKRLN